MKELSIEQKLRDIEVVKQMIADGHISQDVAEKYFPELKEDEDELTWLKNYISEEAYSLSMDIRDNEDRIKLKKLQRSVAWLEKQSESKSYWKPTEEQYEALTYAYNICSDTDRGNYYEGVLETLIEDLHRLDEQHPKFKVGDVIKEKSTGDIVTISVVDLKNREYRLSNTGFIRFKYEHLWELVEIEQDKHDITIGTKIRSKANPDVILTIISDDCHEDEFECSNGSVLSLKQIEKYYERID